MARHRRVEILLSTYAKCVHGQQSADRKRIEEALGGSASGETKTDDSPEDHRMTDRDGE